MKKKRIFLLYPAGYCLLIFSYHPGSVIPLYELINNVFIVQLIYNIKCISTWKLYEYWSTIVDYLLTNIISYHILLFFYYFNLLIYAF